MSNLFARFFPTPEFLSMKAVGLSITDTAIRFVEFDSGENRKEVVQKGEIEIPKGIVDKGVIVDSGKLSDLLKEVRDIVGTQFVAASIPDEKAYVYKTEVPASDDASAIRSAVEASIEQNAPLRLDQVTFDFDIIKRHSTDTKKDHVDVAVSVVPTKVINIYIAALEDAGFVPTSFDLESRSIAHSVVKHGDKTVSIVVHIDDTKTALFVVSDKIVHFSSSVDLTLPKKQATETGDAVAPDVSQSVQVIGTELKKVYDFWNNQTVAEKAKDRDVKKVIVCGERAADPEVIKQIESVSPVQVEQANVWINAFSFDEYIPDIPLSESLGFAPAVGLALVASEDNTKKHV